MLTNRIGLDPAAVGSTLISRAVRIRMNELGLGDVDSYTSLISGSEIELQALIEEVVVPESWFFRDEAPFRHFQDHVRAGWVANPARSPLRVLSIPCAGVRNLIPSSSRSWRSAWTHGGTWLMRLMSARAGSTSPAAASSRATPSVAAI